MSLRGNAWWLAPVLFAVGVHAAAATVEDFDQIATLSGGDESILKVELPIHVLRDAQRADLADVHVFDARGQLLPSKTYHTRAKDQETTVDLPFYPFDADTSLAVNGYSLQIDQNTRNARIDVYPDGRVESDATKTGYVVHIADDIRQQHGRLSQLTLQWAKPDANLIVPVRVESSADLQQWRTLVDKAVVTDLQHNGTTLVSNEIKLGSQTGAYLRLTWPDSAAQFELEKITGEFSRRPSKTTRLRHQRLSCDAQLTDICQFELPPQIAAVWFKLPTDLPDYFMQGSIYTSTIRPGEGKARWIQRGQFQQYRLQVDGQNIGNPALRLPVGRDRVWQLRLGQALADVHVSDVEVSWYPVYQVFLAQGEGPYRLAFGSLEANNSKRAPMDAILERAQLQLDDIEQIQIGQVQTVERGFWTRKRIETYILWTVLLIGVAVLFIIARRLFHSLNASVQSD